MRELDQRKWRGNKVNCTASRKQIMKTHDAGPGLDEDATAFWSFPEKTFYSNIVVLAYLRGILLFRPWHNERNE